MINLVEVLADSDDCTFDQQCKFGNRVETHAVYCHNEGWKDSPRKCRRTWYTGGEVKDEDCEGYAPNVKLTGETDGDEKEFLTFDEAVTLLPAGETVHTFRQDGFILLGVDWEKEELLNALCKAKVIEVAGAQAQAMNHGIAIADEHGWLFIETANV